MFRTTLSVSFFLAQLLLTAMALPAQEQNAPEPAAKELAGKGMPPRAAATEYQSHGKAGNVNIGAEFDGHSVPTPEHTYTSEDYIVVEAGLFGAPDAHLVLSRDDFSLRINGKKVLPSEPFELVFKSLKDPEWIPPESKEEKSSKGGLTTGDGGGGGEKVPPLPPKMPFELRRAMNLHVQRSAMLEGDRALPQAGLLFFAYRGKPESIKSMELIYSGAGGKATIDLQP